MSLLFNFINKLNQKQIIKFDLTESSHDWWHIYGVLQITKTIAINEDCDQEVVELGALLADIKVFFEGSERNLFDGAIVTMTYNSYEDRIVNRSLSCIER